MSGVPKKARKASEHVKREEGGVKLQQDGRTEGQSSPSFHLSLSSLSARAGLPPHGRMATVYLPLALVLLLSCPASARWWNFFSIYPKTCTSPPPTTSPSAAEETTEWFSEEEKSEEGGTRGPGGSGSVGAGTSAPEWAAAGRSQYKPLKHWKSGEYPRASQ